MKTLYLFRILQSSTPPQSLICFSVAIVFFLVNILLSARKTGGNYLLHAIVGINIILVHIIAEELIMHRVAHIIGANVPDEYALKAGLMAGFLPLHHYLEDKGSRLLISFSRLLISRNVLAHALVAIKGLPNLAFMPLKYCLPFLRKVMLGLLNLLRTYTPAMALLCALLIASRMNSDVHATNVPPLAQIEINREGAAKQKPGSTVAATAMIN